VLLALRSQRKRLPGWIQQAVDVGARKWFYGQPSLAAR
jgi:hypothetical protein